LIVLVAKFVCRLALSKNNPITYKQTVLLLSRELIPQKSRDAGTPTDCLER